MTLVEAIQFGKTQILSDSPRLDSEILLAHAIQQGRSYLYTWPEKSLSSEQKATFLALIKQRQEGHPIAHIVGEKEFWGLPFKVNQHTLIPRPDTEVLVEKALELLASCHTPKPSVLDLGTGSGAIICAIKSEMPEIKATAVDYQVEALTIAQQNAQNLQLDISFCQSNWFSALTDQYFDIIVSNPPYIEENDPHLSEGDVRFDPITALTSGESGLEDLQVIIKTAKLHLNDQAWLIVEHGYNQATAVQQLFEQAGYCNIGLVHDYNQNARVSYAQWQKS